MYHPAIKFLYGLCVVLLGLVLQHPLFTGLSLTAAVLFYLLTGGGKDGRLLLFALAAIAAAAILNPLFSAEGTTVIARLPWGRQLTAEAVFFGVLTGAGCAAVLLWFAAFCRCGAAEVTLHLFSAVLPNLALVLAMVLRLLPLLRQKAEEIRAVRTMLGSGRADHTALFSCLVAQALEGAVTTAESMKNRGCGCGRRTSFRAQPPAARDGVLLAALLTALLLLAVCAWRGALRWQCYPQVQMAAGSQTVVAAAIYAALVFWPSVRIVTGRLSWKFLRSKI